EVAVGDGGADDERPVGVPLDPVVGEARDVHELGGRLDAEPHQVHEVRAAAEVAGAVLVPGERVLGTGGALVGERPHDSAPSADRPFATSRSAATMPG